ncbi:MAG: exosortase H [Candidatus Hydrogenedens sp.]|nr:exosortase H [Candidatus Hydrogenedens sp.]
MPDTTETPETQSSGASRGSGRSTFVFVGLFVVIVMVLLTGYRYSVHTRANDWYLFQVAKHTTWALALLGDQVSLENDRARFPNPRQVRSEIRAHDDGRESPTPEDYLAASDDPLTPWEAWSYRAITTRASDVDHEYGPRVEFVLRRGLAARVRDLEVELNDLRENNTLEPSERAVAMEKLIRELRPMRERLNQVRKAPTEEDDDPTYNFHFIVVSECGAIEVMAIFFAAVVAFPTRWWKRLLGILVGVPVMYLVNILRLTCLAVIGAYNPEMFRFAHEYLWQAVYIIFVVVVWMLWVEYVVRDRDAAAPSDGNGPDEQPENPGPVEDGS